MKKVQLLPDIQLNSEKITLLRDTHSDKLVFMSFNPWKSMIIMLYPFPGAFYRGDGWGPGRVRAGPRDRLGPGGLDLRGQGPGPGP